MISIVISKHNNEVKSITLDGHAGFADSGQDIVCAAVSVLVINTFNSIEQFTDQPFTLDASEDGGHMSMTFTEDLDNDSRLLINSLLLGLDEIQKQYGDEYISLDFKEV